MATYNGEMFLREQIDSILSQKNVDVYILVRDDGSTDDTINILKQYSEKENLSWYIGKHLNVAKGYLDLMKHVKNKDFDYFALADQDDVWDEDKLFIAAQNLDQFSKDKPCLYYSGQRLVDQNLKLISLHTLNTKRSLFTRFVLSDFAGCTGVFNRCLLDKVNEYSPTYILMHDTWILKICLALGGNVFVDTGVHMNYRQHSRNTIGLKKGLYGSLRQVHQYIYDYNVVDQMKELLIGYNDNIIPEYKRLIEKICDYKKIENKIYLLNKKNINFYNFGLNITFKLKLLINKL